MGCAGYTGAITEYEDAKTGNGFKNGGGSAIISYTECSISGLYMCQIFQRIHLSTHRKANQLARMV